MIELRYKIAIVITQDKSPVPAANVRLGYTVHLATIVAIGSLVTVGMTVYFFLGPIFELSGTSTPSTYALTIFFFLPLALALAERSSVTPGRGGLFNLSRSSGSVPLAFTTGWLIIGGLLSLAALFAWEGGLALHELISLFSENEFDERWLAVSLILIAVLFTRSQTIDVWRRRSALVYGAILLLATVIFAAWFAPLEVPSTWIYVPSSTLSLSAPFISVSLWSMHFVLEQRDAVRRPRRQMAGAVYLPILVGGLAGAVVAATLLLFPALTYLDSLPILTLAQQIHPLLALAVLFAMLGISFVGLKHSLLSLQRTSAAMVDDGFLPKQLLFGQHVWQRQSYILAASTLITPLLVLLFSIRLNVAQASSAIILALIIIYGQDLLRSRPNLAENRRPKMPFHPFIPGISAAICLTLLVSQGTAAAFNLAGWLLAGALIYAVFARDGAIQVRQRDLMVAGTTLAPEKKGYRVLVAVSDPSKAADLLRLGAQIAAERSGTILVLRVATQTIDDEANHRLATSTWKELDEIILAMEKPLVPATPLVRLAPDAAAGLLTTIWEEKIDLALLGWPAGHAVDIEEHDGAIGKIVQKAQCEVVILRGRWPSSVKRVLVPVISAGHSVAALALGQDLLTDLDDDPKVVALRILRGKVTEESRQQAETQLNHTWNELHNAKYISGEIVGSANPRDEILQTSSAYDLLLLGLSDEGFLAETDFGGLPVEIALNTTLPTLLVKRKEKEVSYWLRRSWDRLSSILPTLSPKRRAVVGADMRHDAQADIDFYVLMVLAASIALLGLLQNSAAVIIGAMLVAPLMSPILAMAQSIVRGQIKVFRQAAESTANGVVLAIAVGALLSLLLLSLGIHIPTTSEILARTQPNFLDLLVALASGAAAAYAISRSEVGAALPGVAIAAALVPPLAVTGYGLGTAQFDIAAGSLLLFLTNLAAIILAAAVVFLLLGIRPPVRDDRDEQARYGLRMAVIALILIAIPLFGTTRASANEAMRYDTINSVLDQYWPPTQAEAVDIVITSVWNKDLTIDCTIYDYAGVVDEQSIAGLQAQLSRTLDQPVILHSKTINVRLDSFDDASAAYNLTQTPTPTSPAVEQAPLFNGLEETVEPSIPATPGAATADGSLPLITATIAPAPSPSVIETYEAPPMATVGTEAVPGETPVPTAPPLP